MLEMQAAEVVAILEGVQRALTPTCRERVGAALADVAAYLMQQEQIIEHLATRPAVVLHTPAVPWQLRVQSDA
jgi:hypothetical protein